MLKSKLRRALERDEFVVLYQSKVDLRSGRVVGAEALLRWRLPGHGDISPMQFIPLAEETTLISEIGEVGVEPGSARTIASGRRAYPSPAASRSTCRCAS